MDFHIITIFPEIFNSYFNEGILKRAQKDKLIKINIINLRDFTFDKHKTVDDTPFGGGAGMVMKIEPLYKAITKIKTDINKKAKETQGRTLETGKIKTILFSAKGKTWTQANAIVHKKYTDMILICGRYEGVDERILEFIDEEISIGDFVLTGGEIPAMTIIDSVTRLLPGALGNEASSVDESHSVEGELEYPQYTRPEVFIDNERKEYLVPEILLSGNHKKIEEWKNYNKKKQDTFKL